MKRTFFLSFALMLGLVAYQNASSKTIPAIISRILEATWEWKTTSHDFGKIVQNEPVSVTFEFTNKGDEPIILTNVSPSCGCTTPTYTKDPIMKNGKGFIKAQFNAAAVGTFTKTITVTSNITANKPQVLTITGVVEPKK